MYRETATAEVASKLIGETYPKAVEEQNLKPLGTPELEKGTLAKDQDFSYTATVEVNPEIEVDGYFGLELEKEEIQVTDEQVGMRIPDSSRSKTERCRKATLP